MATFSLKKITETVDYLIAAHCKYKDTSMYLPTILEFQEMTGYKALESMSQDDRFNFLLGFKSCLDTFLYHCVGFEQTSISWEELEKNIKEFMSASAKWVPVELGTKTQNAIQYEIEVDMNPVNKPSHYQGTYGIEVKEVLENFIKDKKGMEAHRWCSAVEYLLRYAEKNGVEDLEKARKNLDWLIAEGGK